MVARRAMSRQAARWSLADAMCASRSPFGPTLTRSSSRAHVPASSAARWCAASDSVCEVVQQPDRTIGDSEDGGLSDRGAHAIVGAPPADVLDRDDTLRRDRASFERQRHRAGRREHREVERSGGEPFCRRRRDHRPDEFTGGRFGGDTEPVGDSPRRDPRCVPVETPAPTDEWRRGDGRRSEASSVGEGHAGNQLTGAHRCEQRIHEVAVRRGLHRADDAVVLDPDEERRAAATPDRGDDPSRALSASRSLPPCDAGPAMPNMPASASARNPSSGATVPRSTSWARGNSTESARVCARSTTVDASGAIGPVSHPQHGAARSMTGRYGPGDGE